MSKPVHQHRINPNGENDLSGRLFVCPRTAAITDLSNIRILHSGVDTVRQLYRGELLDSVLDLFIVPGIVRFAGYAWHAGRIGRDSGYQYKLQNADLGLVLLIKNFNVSDKDAGPHLKIEVSPHLIQQSPPDELQTLLDTLAAQVLLDPTPNQCAVHLAVDIQGWTPPADLIARMHCRSRKVRDISGINTYDMASNASVYGRGETWMFGSANATQLCIYNKTLQARTTDKLDFWQSIWRQSDNPFDVDDPLNYSPVQDVYRLELRFHHSVIQQFSEGSTNQQTGEILMFRTYEELVPHLDALLPYGLQSFRLLSARAVYDPLWTLLMTNVNVTPGNLSLTENCTYKRHYKTAAGFTGKNVDLFLGNLVSLLARERIGATKAFAQLQKSDIYPVVLEHFENKGKTERDIYRWLRDKLQERTIRYGVAV